MAEFEFKVKFNQQDIKSLNQEILTAFKKVIASNAVLRDIGEVLVLDIVDTTKNEKSIPNKLANLKLLKEAWINRKDRLSKYNKTSPDYEHGKSNLTFTGQLLNSLTYIVEGPGKLKLMFKGNHSAYIGANGKKIGKDISNDKLAGYVAESGRPFMGIRPAMRLRINRIVKSYVIRVLAVARLTK